MSEERERISGKDQEFGPDTGFESESSVSDKAFFQAEAVNPIAENAEAKDDEEYAAEIAAPVTRPARERFRTEENAGEALGEMARPRTSLGYVAIFTAVLSLLFLPSILGPVSAVIGFMAFVRGSRALGIWSIVIGTIAFVSFLTTIPYQY